MLLWLSDMSVPSVGIQRCVPALARELCSAFMHGQRVQGDTHVGSDSSLLLSLCGRVWSHLLLWPLSYLLSAKVINAHRESMMRTEPTLAFTRSIQSVCEGFHMSADLEWWASRLWELWASEVGHSDFPGTQLHCMPYCSVTESTHCQSGQSSQGHREQEIHSNPAGLLYPRPCRHPQSQL